MFLHLSVILFTVGAQPPGRHYPWADTPRADTLPQAYTPETATEADGTHPTGMYSSLCIRLL